MASSTKLKVKEDLDISSTNFKSTKSITPSTITDSFLNKLVHTASHDLRSPMFVIRSYAQLLQRIQDKDKLKKGFDLIGEATYTMEKTINALLKLIDIYTRPTPALQSVSFSGVFEHVKIQLYNEIKVSSPKFIIDFQAFPEVEFSEIFLKEVMLHLIENSILHNEGTEDLVIRISTFKVDKQLVLEISDNGKGIALEENIDKIKQPFYSSSSNPKRIGIGLSKVEAIAQVSNAKLKLESQFGLGMICQFYF